MVRIQPALETNTLNSAQAVCLDAEGWIVILVLLDLETIKVVKK